MINARTRVCAVIGDPIEHSLSPPMHNAAFAAQGLNFVYVAFRVKHVRQAMEGMRGLGLHGLSVTIPHKSALLPYLDVVDPIAEHIGAVNTVVSQEDGRLAGYNTDGVGARKALEAAGVNLEGAAVVLIGSGGAARAVAFTLATEAAIGSLTIAGVEEAQRDGLVNDLRARTGVAVEGILSSPEAYRRCLPGCRILINASPIGMSPKVEDIPVPVDLLSPHLTVFDIVYNPLQTRLLREAEAKGCRTVPGVEMFLWQAAAQFELWTKAQAPLEIMRRVVLDALEEKR